MANVREALDIAVAEFDRLTADSPDDDDPVRSAGQAYIQDELEWRFSRLRALLGLESACVDPPVARALAADLMERLLPHIRSALSNTFAGDRNADASRILADVLNRQIIDAKIAETQ